MRTRSTALAHTDRTRLQLRRLAESTVQVFGPAGPRRGTTRFAFGVDEDSRERLADFARRAVRYSLLQ